MTHFNRHLMLAASLVAFALPHASARDLQAPSAPKIESVEVDAAQQQLTIHGRFFSTKGAVLTLGSHKLPVVQASSTQLIATMPDGLRPATYKLQISSPPSHINASTFFVQVPATAGPERVAFKAGAPRQ